MRCAFCNSRADDGPLLVARWQVTAQKNQWELDKLQTQSEMLKKFTVDEVDAHSKDGAYVMGLSMQGARWDHNGSSIEKSKVSLAKTREPSPIPPVDPLGP